MSDPTKKHDDKTATESEVNVEDLEPTNDPKGGAVRLVKDRPALRPLTAEGLDGAVVTPPKVPELGGPLGGR